MFKLLQQLRELLGGEGNVVINEGIIKQRRKMHAIYKKKYYSTLMLNNNIEVNDLSSFDRNNKRVC